MVWPGFGLCGWLAGGMIAGMTETGMVGGGRLTDWVSLGVLASWVPRDAVDDAVAVTGRGARRAGGSCRRT
jgi:hypothetical protein